MEIQTVPLTPDVEYFLDAAHENSELDAGSLLVLKLFGPRRQITDIVDSAEYEFGTSEIARVRINKCERLIALADDVFTVLDNPTRATMASAGLFGLRHEIKSLASCLAQWAIEDEIKGGCARPYKTVTRRVTDYRTTPKQDRKLSSRKWISRYVKVEPESSRLRQIGTRVRARLGSARPKDHTADAERMAAMMQAQHEGFRRTNERMMRQYYSAVYAKPLPRRARRAQRKVIRRALGCAQAVLGARTVADFAAGREVCLAGQQITLEVARAGSSAALGHGGLLIRAVCPSTTRRLADLCIYHEKTPALDQLVALALSMRAGEEAEIIGTANLSNITDLGMSIPMIAARDRGRFIGNTDQPRDRRKEVNEAYWQRTKTVWLETLGVFSLGRLWQRDWTLES